MKKYTISEKSISWLVYGLEKELQEVLSFLTSIYDEKEEVVSLDAQNIIDILLTVKDIGEVLGEVLDNHVSNEILQDKIKKCLEEAEELYEVFKNPIDILNLDPKQDAVSVGELRKIISEVTNESV